MTELTDFLLARITEDEALALIAQTEEEHQIDAWHTLGCEVRQGDSECDCGVPARVLAECDAKRRIVERHPRDHASCATYWDRETCAALLDLAAVYADHPDYQQEWKP